MTTTEKDWLDDMYEKEIKKLLSEFEVMIEDSNTEEDIRETANNIFMDEMNYNNGDIESGQYSFSEDDIYDAIVKYKEELKND